MRIDRKALVLAGLAAGGECTYTPVQVQKLFFLIDRNAAHLLGGPCFNFEPYNYGPFDADVYRTLEGLQADGLVEIAKDGTMNTYRPTEQGKQEGEKALGLYDPKLSEYIKHISEFVRSLSFNQLVSAIYKAYPDMKQNSVFQQ